jgi:hypothetical protein
LDYTIFFIVKHVFFFKKKRKEKENGGKRMQSFKLFSLIASRYLMYS